MADAHRILGAHLYRLWVAGRNALPTVAAVHANADNDLFGFVSSVDGAFTGGDNFGGGGYGPVHTPWTTLVADLEQILRTTSHDIQAVGVALCLAVQAFSEQDHAAAAEFRSELHHKGDPPLVAVPRAA